MAKTILVVEDDALNRRLFVDVLEANGYRTVAAESGDEIVAMVRRHRPDLILMDIGLPLVAGLAAARAVKAEADLCDIPVVAITACAMPGDEASIRGGGCDGYLAKPVSVRTYLETVRSFAG